MPSDAQIRANRENAKKSTGPTSAAGRAISSQNAAKHRMFAVKPVAGPEDEQEYQTFLECLRDQYLPQTDIEMDQIYKMADARWRYLRSCEEEQALYDLDYQKHGSGPYNRGEALMRMMDSKYLQYCRRCQNSFDRKYEKALAELLRLQKVRKEEELAAEKAAERRAKLEAEAIADFRPGWSKTEVEAEMAEFLARVQAHESKSAPGAEGAPIGFVSSNPKSEAPNF